MNFAQVKCIFVFAIFAIIGFGPVSPGCLIGMYIVVARPRWFLELTDKVYENLELDISVMHAKNSRMKSFLTLLALFIIDIAPFPVTPIIAFFIILSKPIWFYQTVKNVYSGS